MHIIIYLNILNLKTSHCFFLCFLFLGASPSARFTDDSLSRAAPRSQVGRGYPSVNLFPPPNAGLMIRGLLTIGFTPICWNWRGHGSSDLTRLVVSHMFYFHPENWERFPFLTYIFQLGWFNHQPVNHWFPQFVGIGWGHGSISLKCCNLWFSGWWFDANSFDSHPYLGKWFNLASIFLRWVETTN